MSRLFRRLYANDRETAWAVALIALATVAAYITSLSGALQYDDRASITENESIRRLWPVHEAFLPPAKSGTGGRPVANFTFALSYAMSGLQAWGHHVVNTAIHLGAALTLFAVVRRTLLLGGKATGASRDATRLAAATGLLWALHPVLTQTVTYLSQRTEALMALFYLLTLYAFIRAVETARWGWYAASVLACFLGAMSKEIMATAPLMVLLYDRTFLSGSFGGALRSRWRFYLGLASSWLLLAVLLVGVRERGVGYGLGISWFHYLLTQCQALVVYLSLSLWPAPLVFDRGVDLLKTVAQAAPFIAVVVLVVGTTLWMFLRRFPAGFLLCWFFLILAPASSVIPVMQQPIGENRVYLSCAGIVTLGVLAAHAVIGLRRSLWAAGIAVLAFGLITARRNLEYRSEIRLWTDTALKAPLNARAHYNLGVALDYAGRRADAIARYQRAIEIAPRYPEPYNNLGNALSEDGRMQEAIPFLETAIELKPDFADAHYNLGYAWLRAGNPTRAIELFQKTAAIDPRSADNYNNWGVALITLGRHAEAPPILQRALALRPNFADAHSNLSVALFQMGRVDEAISHCELALRLKPTLADARRNLEVMRSARRP